MSFLDISNGCGSCASFGEIPKTQMMNVDNNTQNLANMVASNVQNTNNTQQINNQMVADGMVQQPRNNVVVDTKPQNNVVVNTQPQNNVVVKKQPVITQNTQVVNTPKSQKINDFVVLCLVVVSALAINETVKYHINQIIKFNEGTPMYYVGYIVVSIVLTYVVFNYLN